PTHSALLSFPTRRSSDLGEYQRAVEVYREALAQDPGNARTYYDLALALDRLGKIAEEREALLKAISIDSTIARAHNQLGLISLQDRKSTRLNSSHGSSSY